MAVEIKEFVGHKPKKVKEQSEKKAQAEVNKKVKKNDSKKEQ